jgi:His/Glu/Gln/Arg/opine family amino acid ABC transporter permease subunit
MGLRVSIINYIPLFMSGASVTLAAWLLAGSLSIVLGGFLGIISSHYIGSTKVINIVKIYTFITKGIPAYVQILIAYFVIPSLLGITISGFVAASLALALCSSGYVTEIIRSSINAIAKGQWDACFVLGYPLRATIQRIIAPQTLRIALPALIGELESLLKSTSLLATIGVTEVTRVGMNIISRELNPLPVYCLIACIYLGFSALLNLVIMYAKKRGRYGYR